MTPADLRPLLPNGTTTPSPALWRMLVLPASPNEHAALPFLQSWLALPSATATTTVTTRWHLVAIVPSAAAVQALQPSALPAAVRALAAQLQPHWQGLLPGCHRITLDQNQQQLQLTLWVGDTYELLRQQQLTADALWLPAWPAIEAAQRPHFAKALARHCTPGTSVLAPAADFPDWLGALRQSGFVPPAVPAGTNTDINACANTATHVHTRYAPAWQPRQRTDASPAPLPSAGHALIVGAGLAGSAVAYSLASRGWRVTVLGMGTHPADGASGLPAGLFCPHISPDDSILSRLSRSGVRTTLQRLRQLCQPGQDWAQSGVLEHCTDGGTGLPAHWPHGPGQDWSQHASATQLQTAGLPPDTDACWHRQAGWVRPAQLVQAQLAHPHIHFQGHASVAQLCLQPNQRWQALDAQGHRLADADIAVLASGPGTAALLEQLASQPHVQPHTPQHPAPHWPLQPIRGQVTWGWHSADAAAAQTQRLPPFPVNGHGNLVTHVPCPASGRALWVMGSTFERDVSALPISAADQAAAHAVNHGKLSTLLPATGAAMAAHFEPANAPATWGHIRVASHDRLPLVGPVLQGDGTPWPGLWMSTAMGSRGLTLSALCGELLAARLHGEPLPLDSALATHLATERVVRTKSARSKPQKAEQ